MNHNTDLWNNSACSYNALIFAIIERLLKKKNVGMTNNILSFKLTAGLKNHKQDYESTFINQE